MDIMNKPGCSKYKFIIDYMFYDSCKTYPLDSLIKISNEMDYDPTTLIYVPEEIYGTALYAELMELQFKKDTQSITGKRGEKTFQLLSDVENEDDFVSFFKGCVGSYGGAAILPRDFEYTKVLVLFPKSYGKKRTEKLINRALTESMETSMEDGIESMMSRCDYHIKKAQREIVLKKIGKEYLLSDDYPLREKDLKLLFKIDEKIKDGIFYSYSKEAKNFGKKFKKCGSFDELYDLIHKITDKENPEEWFKKKFYNPYFK